VRHTTLQRSSRHCSPQAGLTIIELMITMLVIGLITAMVIPNLFSLIPETRIDSAARQLVRNVDFLRSEARITGQKLRLELDLDESRWRYVMPPELQLTSDQDAGTLEEQFFDWSPLEDDVRVLSAGNGIEGYIEKGIFKLSFDENGFTSDQSVVLQLESDPNLTWTIHIHGLTGNCEIVEDYEGNPNYLGETNEAAF
jgi:prepilin-type N-terminal cleavage/methylation domain-containing protein